MVFNGVGASGRRYGDGPVDECSEEGWDWTLSVNLTSMFLICKYTIPALMANGGAIVNLSSVLGLVGGDEDCHARLCREQGWKYRALAGDGIVLCPARCAREDVITPGLIATPMSRRAQTDPNILARLKQLSRSPGSWAGPKISPQPPPIWPPMMRDL